MGYISRSRIGEDYLAANTILMQFIILSSFFLDAYAFSTEGIVGFAIGRRSRKSFRNSKKFNLFKFFYLFDYIDNLFDILQKIIYILTDIEILRFLSFQYILWVIIIPPIACFCYQLDGIFIDFTIKRN